MVVDKAIGVLEMGITYCWELTSVEVCLKNNTHLQRIMNLQQNQFLTGKNSVGFFFKNQFLEMKSSSEILKNAKT